MAAFEKREINAEWPRLERVAAVAFQLNERPISLRRCPKADRPVSTTSGRSRWKNRTQEAAGPLSPNPGRSINLRALAKPAIAAQVGNQSCERIKACLSTLAMLACAGCSDACQNTVASSSLSPNRALAAVLFQRDCGATTGFSTQISILPPDNKPTGGGNAFIADDDHGAARVGSWEGSWAEAKWLSPDHLLIRYAAKSRLFKRGDIVSGVKITYQVVGS